jgi:hypothetical protein
MASHLKPFEKSEGFFRVRGSPREQVIQFALVVTCGGSRDCFE